MEFDSDNLARDNLILCQIYVSERGFGMQVLFFGWKNDCYKMHVQSIFLSSGAAWSKFQKHVQKLNASLVHPSYMLRAIDLALPASLVLDTHCLCLRRVLCVSHGKVHR